MLWCLSGDPAEDAALRATGRFDRDSVWERVIDTAVQHRVIPEVRAGLRRLELSVPAAVLADLDAAIAQHLERTEAIRGLVREILRACAGRGLRVLPYKWADLARVAYGDEEAREYRDLDLLVHPRDVAVALSTLGSLGYSIVEGQRAWPKSAYLRLKHEYTLCCPGRPEVDLHWGLAPPHVWAPDLDALWDRLGTARLRREVVPAMRPEDMLLMTAVHGTRHGWQSVRLIADVAGLVRNVPDLDVEAVIREARRTRCSRMLAVGLELSRLVLGAVVPEMAERFLAADPQAARLAGDRAMRLFPHGAREYARFEIAAFQLASLDGTRERRRYRAGFAVLFVMHIGVRLFADEDQGAGSSVRRWFRRLTRPFRLLRRHALNREALRRAFRFLAGRF